MLLPYAVAALLSAWCVLAADDTESTSTITIQSFLTITASPTTTTGDSANGLGGFIMQGLGSSDNSSSTAQALPAPATTAPFPTENSTAAVDWEACQTSKISWSDAWTSVFQPEVVTTTNTFLNKNDTVTFNVTFGNADIYTTIDGIPHAHGTLEPTSTSQYVDTYIETAYRTVTTTETLEATLLNPSPNCTIAPSKCTALWESYLGEQGMPTTFDNATEPAITPMPTERPRCSVGDVKAFCETAAPASCVFSARKVSLYYWPVVTAAPNASLAALNPTDAATQVVGNITMTSPSVYMIFDHLQAISSSVLDITCSTTSPLGAESTFTRAEGGAAMQFVGGPYTNAVVSLDPLSLTSLVRDLGPVNTASVVSEIAHGGPSYEYWINAVQGTGYNYDNYIGRGFSTSVLAQPVDFHNLAVPKAEAYYMNINGAPGCNRMGAHPQCSTIFDGDYRAQLLVPEQIRSLRADWASCYDPLFGALDPPIALTPAAAIKAPTKPAETTAGETSAPDATTQADTVKAPEQTTAVPGPSVPANPSPTSDPSETAPTAVPATTPDEESDDKPATDDNPASDDKPASEDKPALNDEPSNNDEPASDNDPTSNNDTADNNASSSEDKPSSDDKPSSNDASSSDNKPSSEDKPSTEDTPATSGGSGSDSGDQPASGSNNGNSDTGGESDQNTNPGNSNSNSQDAGDQGNTSNNGGSGSSNGSSSSDDNSQGGSSANDAQDADGSNQSGSGAGPSQIVSISGAEHTVVAQNGAPVIDGTTLPADGAPKTIGGQVVSAVSGGIAVGTETIRLLSVPIAGSGNDPKVLFTADGQTFTAIPGSINGVVVVDGTTISVGQAAATMNGAVISAATDGVVVDGSTRTYPDAGGSARPAVLTLGSDVATASSVASDVFAVGSVTLTAGERGTTISGHVVSAAPTGIVVDGASGSASTSNSEQASRTQGNESSTSSAESDDASATSSGASRLHVVHWVALICCGLVLIL